MGAAARGGSGVLDALSWNRWRGAERVLGGAAVAVATVGVCVGLLGPSDTLGAAPQLSVPAGPERPAPPSPAPSTAPPSARFSRSKVETSCWLCADPARARPAARHWR